MKKTIAYSMIFGVFMLIPWLCPQPVTAHGTGYRILSENKAVTAEFYYSDGEPMSYAQVLVFSPDDDKTEYQNGRTDQQGRFAFYPDKVGKWRIEVNDGMGHKAQGSVDMRDTKAGEEKSEKEILVQKDRTGTSSKLMKSIAGLSLIFNIFFVIYLWKRKGVRSEK